MKIAYLKHNQIEKAKWDNCITKSFNGIVYAYSWYLDLVSKGWEALVQGDYIRVFPLTCGEKYNIKYLYQPYFTQQLGVFSTQKLNPEIINQFLEAIPIDYQYIEINVNILNKVENDGFELKNKITYELDLMRPYEKLKQNFSTNTKRNIRKAEKNEIKILNSVPSIDVANMIRKNTGIRDKNLKEQHYEMMRLIILKSLAKGYGQFYCAYNKENVICSLAYFLTSHNKSIFLFSTSSQEGKDSSAMFMIIDQFIRKNSEKNLTLDFEGSNIPSLARFYESFGSKACNYVTIKQNRLPWYIKLFKR